MMLTYSSVREVDELTSNQEEVDFGLLIHAQHSLKSESATPIRSNSGDTDIFVMVLFAFSKEPLFIDPDTSTSRKVICIVDFNVNKGELTALIGFHAMTGGDYVSSFFKKGKTTCWKKMIKKAQFTREMMQLGDNVDISKGIYNDLEAYVYMEVRE